MTPGSLRVAPSLPVQPRQLLTPPPQHPRDRHAAAPPVTVDFRSHVVTTNTAFGMVRPSESTWFLRENPRTALPKPAHCAALRSAPMYEAIGATPSRPKNSLMRFPSAARCRHRLLPTRSFSAHQVSSSPCARPPFTRPTPTTRPTPAPARTRAPSRREHDLERPRCSDSVQGDDWLASSNPPIA